MLFTIWILCFFAEENSITDGNDDLIFEQRAGVVGKFAMRGVCNDVTVIVFLVLKFQDDTMRKALVVRFPRTVLA